MEELYRRVEQLTAAQRTELARRLQSRREVLADEIPIRLAAYVVPRAGSSVDAAELRAYLKGSLPEYMIPSSLTFLESLPRTPNGKVNHLALTVHSVSSEPNESFAAPRNSAEEKLVEIWSSVLGVDRVSIHDNFFEIGGDSILSIQIIAKARQAGLQLMPNQLFQHQTVAELAVVVDTGPQHLLDPGPLTGDVPLTPIQYWFFEQPLPAPHHWNQTLLLEAPANLDLHSLHEAFGAVLKQHDALRLRFSRGENGWEQHYTESPQSVRLVRVDISSVPENQRASAMEEAATQLQASLDLATGPLIQAALFESGESGVLLIALHHLVVDLISWQILLEDLESAYVQLCRGEVVNLPRKTSSFKAWSDALTSYANSDDVLTERAFWLSQAGTPSPIPVDLPGTFTEASARTLAISLSVDETHSLLHRVPSAYNTKIEDVLLTALVQSFRAWTGVAALVIGLERHGREEIADGLDLSRTVGWFTSYFPLLLNLEGASTPGRALSSIKEQLHRIPRQGVGYGLIRYMCPKTELVEKLRSSPQPELLFSYGGRTGSPASGEAVFQPVQTIGISRNPSNRRDCLLEINAYIAQDRLHLNWTYSTDIHRADTIERVVMDYMEGLRSLIAHCLSPDAGGYTPSDFPEAGLSQEELDRFVGKLFS